MRYNLSTMLVVSFSIATLMYLNLVPNEYVSLERTRDGFTFHAIKVSRIGWPLTVSLKNKLIAFVFEQEARLIRERKIYVCTDGRILRTSEALSSYEEEEDRDLYGKNEHPVVLAALTNFLVAVGILFSVGCLFQKRLDSRSRKPRVSDTKEPT